MTVTYQREVADDALMDELFGMFEKHRQELSKFDDMKLNPNKDVYFSLEQNDCLRMYTAREEGKVVGYACFFVLPNMHYSDFMYATQDIFYVSEEKRKSLLPMRLLKFTEKELKKDGVHIIVQHSKLTNNFSPFLEKMGYECIEKLHAKRIN